MGKIKKIQERYYRISPMPIRPFLAMTLSALFFMAAQQGRISSLENLTLIS